MTPDSKEPVTVYFYEAFEEEEQELRSLIGDSISCGYTSKTIQEAGEEHPPAKLISIRTQSKIPVAWCDELEGILSRSTGYDHLIAYRSEIRKPLPMGYLDEYASRAVAEQAILHAMALLRKLPVQMKNFRAFDRDGLTGGECPQKNCLVVGVGRIGGEIYRIARSLGFTVKGVDLMQNKKDVDYVSKETGIRWADVIICSMNLTSENMGYFNYEFMKSAKPGAIFVNIARGEHSPIRDLTRLLEEKRLGGVGLDVYEDEGTLGASLRNPAMRGSAAVEDLNRLAGFPNVILTPHNAFNTVEAVRRKSQMSVEQIRHFLKNKDFLWKLS
ncbi:MAG TPA: NAD(P)-dependent oxidoreductase [Terriglobia bacterium]|nr:NAD(P)-dependent oxidoreductase [Terriglobia bacterium]